MKNGTHVYLTYIFCITICVLPSCNKESGPTTVNGIVKDVTTNVGVSNAEVGLFETDGESAFGLGGVLMAEKYSDASGEFDFNFDAREGYSYYVQATKEQYWNDQSNNVTFIENLGRTSNTVIYLQPEGYLHLKILDIPPYLINSEFRMTPFNGSFWVPGIHVRYGFDRKYFRQ
ncbi:MAG: hypothetical protein IPH42_09920 [Bacteroidetes bacterium]|nr:hypothetical protein [Bacteroidota bacterium]